MSLKELGVYAVEVLIPKNKILVPRTDLGVHLSYENWIRGKDKDRLRFHLERNLGVHGSDGSSIGKLFYQVEGDFRLLAVELLDNPSFQGIQWLEGITNFKDRTGKRYGFSSEVIITSGPLCTSFDDRIEKPRASVFGTPDPIRRFIISREDFLARFSPDSPRTIAEPRDY